MCLADAVAGINHGCTNGIGQSLYWHRFPSHCLAAGAGFSFPKASHRLISQAQFVQKPQARCPVQ